jgi:hypothetical protein
MATFTNQPISASYQRVLQIDGGQIQDGLGNAVTASILGISASQGFTGSLQGTASFAISSSRSIGAISASFATTASHLTGIVTSASYALTASYVSGSSLTASYALTASYVNTLVQDVIISGSVSISGSLTVSGSNTFTNIGPTIFSGSVTSVGGFTGSLEGTATTASYAVTASFLTVDATASYALTASFLAGTIESASFAQNAQTASYILNAVSSSFALTASYALNAGSTVDTGSYVTTSSFDNFTGSIQSEVNNLTAATASYITSAQTSSMNVLSASYALTASYALNAGSTVDTSSFVTTSSFNNFTGSIQNEVASLTAATASYIISAQTSSMSVLSASFASTASYVENAVTASYFSGSILEAISASYAATASYLLGSLPDVGFNFSQSVSSNTWTIQHNLNTLTPLVQVYDDSYNQLIPASVSSSDANTTIVGFSSGRTGYAIVSKGSGFTTSVASASLASTASYISPTAIGYNHVQTVSSDTWTVNHNLNNQYPLVQVYDSNRLVIIPQSISGSSTSTTIITFSSPRTGYVRVI